MSKKRIATSLLAVAMAAGSLFTGCSSSQGSSTSAAVSTGAQSVASAESASTANGTTQKKIKIGFALKTQDSPYFVALADAMKKSCAANGWDCTVLDANSNTSKEAENMETFISQKMDMIFIDSIDPDACVSSINQAADAGIGVIAVDSGVNATAKTITTVYSDNKQNGRLVGLAYAKKMAKNPILAIVLSGAKGNVAGQERREGVFTGIIEGRTGMSESDAWKASATFDNDLSSKGKATNSAANFTVAAQGWGAWTRDGGLKAAEDLITANKNLTTVIGENDQMLFGAMTALQNANITGVDQVAAADGAKEAYQYIKQGKYFATGENNPKKVVEKAVEISKDILVNGKDKNSFAKITKTTPNAVTKDNVDQFYDANSIF